VDDLSRDDRATHAPRHFQPEERRVLALASQRRTLDVGAPADVCVFDPGAWWKVERAALRSQGKNTPFLGHEVPGQVRWTIVSGHVVHVSSH